MSNGTCPTLLFAYDDFFNDDTYRRVYRVIRALETCSLVVVAVLITVLHPVILRIRVVHINLTLLLSSCYAAWQLNMYARAVQLLLGEYKAFGYYEPNGDMLRYLSGVRMLGMYYSIHIAICVVIERAIATALVHDYERTSRIYISVTMITFNALFTAIVTFLLTECYLNSLYYITSLLLPIVASVCVYFVILRLNERRVRRLESTGFIDYTLSLRTQLRENILILKLVRHGSLGAGVVIFLAIPVVIVISFVLDAHNGPNRWQLMGLNNAFINLLQIWCYAVIFGFIIFSVRALRDAVIATLLCRRCHKSNLVRSAAQREDPIATGDAYFSQLKMSWQ